MASKYRLFTTNEIKPIGWTKKQLEIQAEGLAGNLDKVWPDVRDSMWIGGDCDGWERVPYWLDGFIPLAYLLDDDDMKLRAKKYIDCIIANQKKDGWICPNGKTPREKYDTWAVLLITKVLVVYAECSRDERIAEVVYKIMKNYYNLLKKGKISLFAWSRRRWYEGFIALNWLSTLYPDKWIRELARYLHDQGTDYSKYIEEWKIPLNRWTQETHVVNLAMMLKSEAISHELLNDEYTGLADKLYSELMKYNGMPVGTFTGDECLSGRSPIQGVECCAVVELMYSLELLYACTGDKKWAELLERVSFNALPATLTDDTWGHQYVQMSNQIDCTPFWAKAIFRTNTNESHVFGLEPNYGCCTSNYGQGWPKLVLSTFMRSQKGVICAMPIPARLDTEWKGSNICIRLDTDYPFRNSFRYTVTTHKKTDMQLSVRIPSFAKNIKLNGKDISKRSMLTFNGFDEGITIIEISFETEPQMVNSPTETLKFIECGSLVFALPIDADITLCEKEHPRKNVVRKFPYCDYYYKGVSDWSFAYSSKELKVEERPISDVPFFSTAPSIVVKAKVVPINWGYADGYLTVCARLPQNKKPCGEEREVTLYPYGCAKLRMTEMPLINMKK